jgi:3-mercaptopropionate dioxygenase
LDLIKSFCAELRELLGSTNSQSEIFHQGRRILSDLALRPLFLKEVFRRYATDDEFLKSRQLTVDPNEITIFVDPARLFSLRLYVWDPAVSYPVHSHGSWGVVACVSGKILERKFKVLDKVDPPGFAKIIETGRSVLKPGDTTTVLPLERGIHQMEAVAKEHSSISLHLYGKAVRRGFLECYNHEKDSVYRVMNPYLYGRVCALRALGAIGEDWAAEILGQAAADKKAHIKFEAIHALARLDKDAALKYLEEEMAGGMQSSEDFEYLLRILKKQFYRINMIKNRLNKIKNKVKYKIGYLNLVNPDNLVNHVKICSMSMDS